MPGEKNAPKIIHYKNLKTSVVWDTVEGSEAQKRCARLKMEYEEVKPDEKKKEPV